MNFAPDLIAAKPVKPCDRGVFWALDLLLKRDRKHTHSGRVCLALCVRCLASGHECRSQPGFTGRLQGGRGILSSALFIAAACQPVFAAARCKPSFFAVTSIADKPVKPCGRGVFLRGLEFALFRGVKRGAARGQTLKPIPQARFQRFCRNLLAQCYARRFGAAFIAAQRLAASPKAPPISLLL